MNVMNARKELLSLLNETLHLEGRTASFDDNTPLLGALPEMDSMGVVSLLTAFEDRLGFTVDDDEIDGSVFQTFGTLLTFVQKKLGVD
jgi:acyl carrier protein